MSKHLFTSEEEAQVRDFIRSLVQSGFTPRESLLEDTVDYFVDDFEAGDLKPLVGRLIEEEWAAHAREQATWDGLTDCDRLDLAFAALEKSGVVARQDFSCCGTCGSHEIWDEAEGHNFEGYVFYHSQDTERAVEGGGLYLAYGSFKQEEQEGQYALSSVAIGHRIVDALRKVGLQPQWDGTIQHRISLPMDWKKRRSAS